MALLHWCHELGLKKLHLVSCSNKGFEVIFGIELIHGEDEDPVCLNYMKYSKIYDKPEIPVYYSTQKFAFNLCLYIVTETNLMLINLLLSLFCIKKKKLV